MVLYQSPLEAMDPYLSAQLRQMQKDAVHHALQCLSGSRDPGCKACVLDLVMGLGKTLVALATLDTLFKQGSCAHAVVLCPPTLRAVWRGEADRWLRPAGVLYVVLDTPTDMERYLAAPRAALIAGYEYFSALQFAFAVGGAKADVLVIDEAHKLANLNTSVAQAALAVPTTARLILSGTTMRNDNLADYGALLGLAAPGLFGDARTFEEEYVLPVRRGAEGELEAYMAEVAIVELVLRTSFILVLGEDALELPCKYEMLVGVAPTALQVRLLDHLQTKPTLGKAEEEDVRRLLACPRLLALENATDFWASVFERLDMPTQWPARELESHSGALRALVALVTTTLRETEDKIVVAAYRHRSIKLIEEVLRGYGLRCKLLPESAQTRAKVLSEFQADTPDLRILLLRGLGDGTGLTLTAANRIVLFDPDWDPHNDSQMVHRVWRTGQRKECYIYRIVTCGCFDELVLQRGENKEAVDDFVRSGGLSGTAAGAARGVGQKHKMGELLRFDKARPAIPPSGESGANSWRYYEPARDHPVWGMDRPSMAVKEVSQYVLFARPRLSNAVYPV